jgi:hypothetical protein
VVLLVEAHLDHRDAGQLGDEGLELGLGLGAEGEVQGRLGGGGQSEPVGTVVLLDQRLLFKNLYFEVEGGWEEGAALVAEAVELDHKQPSDLQVEGPQVVVLLFEGDAVGVVGGVRVQQEERALGCDGEGLQVELVLGGRWLEKKRLALH